MAHTGAPPSDSHDTDEATVPRGRARWQMKTTTVIVAAATLGITFWLGRATAPPKDLGGSSACTEAQQAAIDMGAQAKSQQTDGQTDAAATTTRTYATLIVQNPGCFNPADRAAAQQVLDQHALDQNSQAIDGLREAQCKAAGKPSWC